jgi:death-on-curing protein
MIGRCVSSQNSWEWISVSEAIEIHDKSIDQYGGSAGIRDMGLLKSALARPLQHSSYSSVNVPMLAAIYTYGIIQNHPFIDGNKRTGFLVGILFLEVNGYTFYGSEDSVIRTILSMASGNVTENQYELFLTQNSHEPV